MKKESFYILGYLLGSYHKIMMIWNFKNSKCGEFEPFSHEKSFVEVEIIYFLGEIWRNFTSRRNIAYIYISI
jgi:hypothetical protein